VGHGMTRPGRFLEAPANPFPENKKLKEKNQK
jgi:hypothetical protein